MNVDFILNSALRALRSRMPEALFKGSLLSEVRAFDPSTSLNSVSSSTQRDAEFIFDTFTEEERSGSVIKVTDVKLYVIATDIKDLSFFEKVVIGSDVYRITKLVSSVVGSTSALFTIAAEKQ